MTAVSVVIPAYNAATYLRTAIESVLAQDTPHAVEVIVVDDGSVDDTAGVAAGFGAKVRLIRQANSGVSAARNAGIRASSGELIALLDADDVMLPGRIVRQVEGFRADPELVLCCSSIRHIDATGALTPDQPAPLVGATLRPPESTIRLFKRNFICTSGVMFRRRAFDQLGGFDTRLTHAEDCELWLGLSRVGGLLVLAEALTSYRLHGNQSIRNEAAMAVGRLAARHYFLKKFPEARHDVSARLVRQVLSSYLVDFGYGLRRAEPAAVKRACLFALRTDPFQPKVWRFLLSVYVSQLKRVRPSNRST
jgi:glycosyltransferase involved in cell wall biosynthesis